MLIVINCFICFCIGLFCGAILVIFDNNDRGEM